MSRSINIIGCGRVGRALGSLFVRNSLFAKVTICNRSLESSSRAAAFVPSAVVATELAELPEADAWMIACTDGAIAQFAQQLAGLASVTPGTLVFHVSGALSSYELSPLKGRGAVLGSLHPVRSIASPELVVSSFAGTACAVEGEPKAVDALRLLVEKIGGKPFQVDSRSKLIYHAGHVFASNYLVTLIDVARRLYAEAGIPSEVVETMLPPIVRGAVDNVCALGTTEALTGPVVRGDVDLVRKQLGSLQELQPEVAALYGELVGQTLHVAARRGHLPPELLEAFRQIARGEE